MTLKIPEASVKSAVEDRLQIAQNQGQLLYNRLNAGDFIEARGESRRRIKGVKKGRPDFEVFQAVKYELFHDGQAFGLCKSRSACRVTFLEIKSSKGKQSPEQIAFEQEAKKMNCRYFVVRDADELVEIIGYDS